MPFLNLWEILPGAIVGLWRLDESTKELSQLLAPNPVLLQQMGEIKLDKRKREFAARHLLMSAMQFDGPVTHLPNGKPMAGGRHISFSHSDDLVAFLVSTRPAGVDLQKPDGKLLRIADKFVTSDECESPSNQELLHCLTRLWTIKEAVFKIYGEGVNFKDVRLLNDNKAIWVGANGRFSFDICTTQVGETVMTVAAFDEVPKSAF